MLREFAEPVQSHRKGDLGPTKSHSNTQEAPRLVSSC